MATERTVYICCSECDEDLAATLETLLKNDKFRVIERASLQGQDNAIERANRIADMANRIVVILSPDFSNSSAAWAEFTTFEVMRGFSPAVCLVPVVRGDVDIPSALQGQPRVEIKGHSPEFVVEAAEKLSELLRGENPAGNRRREDTASRQAAVEHLRKTYRKGTLTLVCGAGVSVGAGLPPWNELLGGLLSDLFDRCTDESETPPGADRYGRWAPYFLPNSPLILAQYLTDGLGPTFRDKLKATLYGKRKETNPDEPDKSKAILEAICALCRPERDRKSLHSIITFNFDDLIEQQLREHGTKHRAIYREGQRCTESEIPIYHVHGLLPEHGDDVESELVFTEDSYHLQMGTPYSWSNLIQLHLYGQNTCLFVGLSLTDPNLRRLLDVNRRKYPSNTLQHVEFKKVFAPPSAAANADGTLPKLTQKEARALARMAQILYEMDAKKLGISVVWIEDHSEIPELLNALLEEPSSRVYMGPRMQLVGDSAAGFQSAPAR